MRVEQNASGTWDVKDNAGAFVAAFATQEAAWRWVDRHEVQPLHLRRETAERLNKVDVKR